MSQILSDTLCTAVSRRDITDAELRELLTHPRRWSYAVRDQHGDVVAWGRGKTRAECENVAIENAAAYAREINMEFRRIRTFGANFES